VSRQKTGKALNGSTDPDVYQLLAQHYTALFPAAPAQLGFIAGLLSATGGEGFLDLACGAGAYTLAVAATGRRALGIDLSPEMISQAEQLLDRHEQERKRNTQQALAASFRVADMRRLVGIDDAEFGVAACIGNSLAHLLLVEDLVVAFAEMARVVHPGGALLLQTVNYDRLDLGALAMGASEHLPDIKRQDPALTFERWYTGRPDALIDFHIRLTLFEGAAPEPRQVLQGVMPLRPWTTTDIMQELDRAGFGRISLFGGFDLRPHDSTAPATVIAALRR